MTRGIAVPFRRSVWLAVPLVSLLAPAAARAAEDHAPLNVNPISVAPFAALLLAVAVMPLAVSRWWHHHHNKGMLSALLALPVIVYLSLMSPETGGQSIRALLHAVQEYASFIILLGSLYVVAGGVVVRGTLRPGPVRNTLVLAVGAVLANLVGTTGASMLLIRPMLRMNAGRRSLAHVVVFFIFVVSNLGGLLTPLGDPPLFLGFLKGVDFFWTLRLWPEWLLVNGLVLGVFLVWDTLAFRREKADPARPDRLPETLQEPVRLAGGYNFLFLVGILAAVLLQAPAVSSACTAWLGRLFPCPDLTLRFPWGEAVMLTMAGLSLALTPATLRQSNGFTWGPILEVAIVFAGLFVTMVPALAVLQARGHSLGVDQPWQYFWLTGLLSSFLDNAPTYVAFGTMAAGSADLGRLMHEAPLLLQAVSCGAVFMGANTYIGNGPNFMVKAIADEAGVPTPSFFGYLLYSCLILLPIFGLVTLLFFLPR
jgi:Na+/H+ antiporter NhaD/arsenite permease-like protein